MQAPPVSFNVGPSALRPEVATAMRKAVAEGILTVGHRSTAFKHVFQEAVEALKAHLAIPLEYEVVFYSSATECWSVLAEGLLPAETAHVYTGSFGEKWCKANQNARLAVNPYHLSPDMPWGWMPWEAITQAPAICLTHNETSNGAQLPAEDLALLREKLSPGTVVAVDATSSLGGVALPMHAADVWFASVQKCLGMPAGLAVMALSPLSVEKIRLRGHRAHYNSLILTLEQAARHEPTHTPNMLAIYLLARVLPLMPPIEKVHQSITARAQWWYEWLEKQPSIRPLIQHPENRSLTVVAVDAPEDQLQPLHTQAESQGYVLGKGYGEWKAHTFRIANFPALTDEQHEDLRGWLGRVMA